MPFWLIDIVAWLGTMPEWLKNLAMLLASVGGVLVILSAAQRAVRFVRLDIPAWLLLRRLRNDKSISGGGKHFTYGGRTAKESELLQHLARKGKIEMFQSNSYVIRF